MFETFTSNWHSGKFFNQISVKRFLVYAVYIYLQDNLIVAPSKDGSEIMSWVVYMICIILGKASSEKFRELDRDTSISLVLNIRSLLDNYIS